MLSSNSRDLLNLVMLLIVIVLFGTILLFGESSESSIQIPCNFSMTEVQYGARFYAQCAYKFTPTSGSNYILLNLPGKNINYAYIQFTNVSNEKSVDISGTVLSGSTKSIPITIPPGAYNVQIYGELIGLDLDGDYPDNPYIHGGNYPLDCGLDCKYNKKVIIDQPGTYNLEIFGGQGGIGIDYKISGSYKISPPTVTIYVNNDKVNTLSVSSDKTIYISDYLSKSNTIRLDIDGVPNHDVYVYAETICSVKGDNDFKCTYVATQEGTTKALCTLNIYSDCDLDGVKVYFSTYQLNYLKDATDASVTVAGKTFPIDPAKPTFYVSDLPEGNYTLAVSYTIPYLVPEAKQAAGLCVLDKNKIVISSLPGSEGTTTFTVFNIGDSPIYVKVHISSELSRYLSVNPPESKIDPRSSKLFTIHAAMPKTRTVVKGEIKIEGCAEELVPLYVELNTSGFDIIKLSISMSVAALVTIGILLGFSNLFKNKLLVYLIALTSFVSVLLLMYYLLPMLF